MSKLVIMESAGKLEKVRKYLGKDYVCVASAGHVIDLPRRKFAVNIKDDFQPTYEIMEDKKNILRNIIKLAKEAEVVYLMADLDREGEAIAWHISRALPKGTKYMRAVTNSITKDAVQAAIKNAGDLNYGLINSYECRRILDRLVGYKCSYPVTMATGGVSVGRTQSAGLRILGEREIEIKEFVPDEYFTIGGTLLSKGKEEVSVEIKKPKPLDINTPALADEILGVFNKGPLKVKKYTTGTAQSKPSAPFMTSTLQGAASTYFGFSLKRTMILAQKLYEKGAITYHRTDSLHIAPAEIAKIHGYIKSKFDVKYHANNTYKTKSKNAQQAHEAIRPTDIKKETFAGDPDQAKLYQLIWKRTVASQMTPAKFERRSARFAVDGYDHELGANGSKLLFDGFKKVWDFSKGEDTYLPDLAEGELVTVKDLDKTRKETKPPSRYSEASVVATLKATGIGRPSTYSAILETLKARDYITIENRSITTTELGLCVLKFCKQVNFCFIDLDFTANMEELLDEIEFERKDKLSTLKDFWARLESDLQNCKDVTKENSKTDLKCPKCESELSKKHSRFGPFYGCTGYPKCKYTAQLGPNGELKEKEKKEKKVIVLSEHDCPKCKVAKMVKRAGKWGEFYGCSTYPKCKGILDKDGNVPEPKWKKKKKAGDAKPKTKSKAKAKPKKTAKRVAKKTKKSDPLADPEPKF